MSVQYPVLDDRPINKWKVAELKEELKRRKLTTKGLKDELVKRLDEAIRIERGAFEEEASRGVGSEPIVVTYVDPPSKPNYVQMADNPWSHETNTTTKVDEVVAGVQIDDLGQGEVQVQKPISGTDAFDVVGGKPVLEASMEIIADDTLNHDTSRIAKIDEVVPRLDITDGPAETHQEKVLEEEVIGDNNLCEMGVGDPILEGSMQTGANDTRDYEISKTSVRDELLAGVDTDGGVQEMDQGKVQEDEAIGGADAVEMIIDEPVLRACMETRIIDNDVAAQIASSYEASGDRKTEQENENLNASLTGAPSPTVEEPVALEASMKNSSTFNDIVVSQTALTKESLQNNEIKVENDDSKPLQMDVGGDASYPNNQVYEVSPNVGFQVKSESISSDAVCVNENNELKDNLNADNVHLELDFTKAEMVQPTSSEGYPNDSNLHSLDDNKTDAGQSFVEETDDNKPTPVESRKEDVVGSSVMLKLDHNSVNNSMRDFMENKPSDLTHNSNRAMDKIEQMEMPVSDEGTLDCVMGPQLSPDKMKTYPTETAASEGKRLQDDNKPTSLDCIERTVADEVPMEKINLDHSSTDDSMEEDILETKLIDSNELLTEVSEKIELGEVSGMRVADTIDSVGIDSDKLESFSEQKNGVATTEKRKLEDEAADGNKEPPKRQRRWNSESLKVSGTQSSNPFVPTVPFEINILKHNLTKSDYTISADAPKERVVPPSLEPPTNSLRIDRFLRPFTLKAVQGLLARTGKVCSFWMDQIKTHCYVTYSSSEEAIETRNALYNLQWPANGGRLLVAEFVDPQEVKLRAEAPPNSTTTPVSTSPTVSTTRAPTQPPSSTQQHGLKQPVSLQPPPLSQPPQIPTAKPLPPPPPVPEKVDQPILTLDDLFRKTKATPRIYYLPLTEEQVAAKLAMQNKNRQQ